MRRKATPRTNARREKALDALLSGQTIAAAAESAGVARCTLHRWLEDVGFRARLEARSRELRRHAQVRLVGLIDRAVEAIEGALILGDSRVALAILRGVGVLTDAPPKFAESDDPEIAARQSEQDKTMLATLADIRRRAI